MMFVKTQTSIYGWGAYIPRFRIKDEEIARIWLGSTVVSSAFPVPIKEKAVINIDEDTLTMSVEAARRALKRAKINPKEIGAVLVGTESNPYAVKSAGAFVARAINADNVILAATYEFACKAGTEAIQTCIGLIQSKRIKYGLAIGADTAQGKPTDELEYTAACGATAFILGEHNPKAAATITAALSYVRETPDFWRRATRPYPGHAQRFTGEPAYFHCIINAARMMLNELNASPKDFTYAVFHQPNYKFPLKVAKVLGFSAEQVLPSIVVDRIGNIYAGSALIGLARLLDIAKPGDSIFFVSYGSGAGSDAFVINVEEGITEKQSLAPPVDAMIENKKYIDYALYARFRRKIMK